MEIEEFDALDAPAATAVLTACADVPSWAATVVAGRPYRDAAALVARADEEAAAWSDADVEGALADHPRIGERHGGAGASAAHAASEQAGVDAQDAEVARRLAEGNRRYEERFDRIFLVRAAGRSAPEILDLLEQRLANDRTDERGVVAAELREIAALRLRGAVS